MPLSPSLWACLLLPLLSLPNVTISAEESDSYTVYHRLAPLRLTSELESHQFPWEARATLQLGFTPIETSLNDIDRRQIRVLSFSKRNSPPSLTLLSKTNVTLYYQLSIAPSHLGPPSEQIGVSSTRTISSAPLCALDTNGRLGQEVQEYFNLWIRPKSTKSEEKPSSFITEDYDLLGINWATTQSCSTGPITSNDVSKLYDRIGQTLSKIDKWKSRISVRLPERLPKPILRDFPTGPTPEILPDGSIKPPPKEQGWLAKYWMYILPIVILLLLGGTAPEEEEGPRPKS
ncbi:hypothetical protein DFH28DRAFT_1127130 [Melampsora americana]|nr:hypothetical protein DFH28DRAFT_1127130 [Melampsora americana]